MGPWDSLMKKLIGLHPEHFVQWLLTDDVTFVALKDIELKNQHRFADALLLVKHLDEYGLWEIECQTHPDPEMGQRLLEYNVLASSQYGLPVFSTVIYLVNTGAIPEPPYIRRFLGGEEVHRFFYQAINLWQQDAQTLLQWPWPSIWPLVTLAKGGKRPEVVQSMIERLVAAQEYDLLAMAQIVGGLAFEKGAEREGFKRRFRMFQDILRESWVYQEIGQEFLQKGLEQGQQQGLEQGQQQGLKQGLEQGQQQGLKQALHQTLLTYVEMRFPQLAVLAQQQTNAIGDPARLNHIISTLFALQTSEEVEQYLLTLANDTMKN